MRMKTEDLIIRENVTIKEAMRIMSERGQKTLFVIDVEEKILGALSDGDIRKWILSGGGLADPVGKICNRKPKIVNEDYDMEEIKETMISLLIDCVPVVDRNREIRFILTWDQVFKGERPKQIRQLHSQVVIVAGGKGTRLDPFTKILPKPLIPINDKPIIEIIMDSFNGYGVSEFYVSVNHKARMIKSYFEEMNDKYKIHYIEEEMPLGTGGALRYLRDKGKKQNPFLVTNCDILIESDYGEIEQFHVDNSYDVTMVVSCRHFVIPYGVCEIENDGSLRGIKEKPEQDLLVNTGMYVLNRKVLDLIPPNQYYNITDLILKAKEEHFKVGVFPISEKSWIDIGQWEEYHKAVERMRINR